MKTAILNMLEKIEREHGIKIIYAVESGSRAWGFASSDSDYDVRYIYIRRTEDYLRVNEIRDTIEGPLDEVMDFSGWDVRKALELLRRTNPSLMEWAASPIVYKTTPEWEMIASRIPEYFSALSNMHHYHSMYLSNWHVNMRDERVKIKKYFYVLRPLLCARWLEKHGTVPPVLFDDLCAAVLPEELVPAVKNLLARKQTADEGELIGHIPELDAFMTAEADRLYRIMHTMQKQPLKEYDGLNRLFRELLCRAWG